MGDIDIIGNGRNILYNGRDMVIIKEDIIS